MSAARVAQVGALASDRLLMMASTPPSNEEASDLSDEVPPDGEASGSLDEFASSDDASGLPFDLASGMPDDHYKEVFPFAGTDEDFESEGDPTMPGEWPLDRQCILRLPSDLAKDVSKGLRHDRFDELDFKLRLLPSNEPGEDGRRWEVTCCGETLYGTMVDLPCRAETHVSPQPKAGNHVWGRRAYKSADISQMLVVHRETQHPELAKKESARRATSDSKEGADDEERFRWSSGVTPQTARKRLWSVRDKPDRIPEAMAAIQARIDNEPYVYDEIVEMDAAELEELHLTQNKNIWRPKDERPAQRARVGPHPAGESDQP